MYMANLAFASCKIYLELCALCKHTVVHLNITHDLGPHRHLPGIKICIYLYRNCYTDPLKAVHGHLPGSERLPWML